MLKIFLKNPENTEKKKKFERKKTRPLKSVYTRKNKTKIPQIFVYY